MRGSVSSVVGGSVSSVVHGSVSSIVAVTESIKLWYCYITIVVIIISRHEDGAPVHSETSIRRFRRGS